MGRDETLRAFVAIELPQAVRLALGRLMAAAQRERLTGVRWVRPEGVHLTLQFLGEVPRGQVGAISAALAEAAQAVPPFTLEVQGVGGFPDLQTPRVVWVGLGGALEPLQRLHHRLGQALAPLGFPPEDRPFTPHLTLGRVRQDTPPAERRRIGQAMARLAIPQGLTVPVTAVCLMQSTLHPEGASYTRLQEVPLGRATPQGP